MQQRDASTSCPGLRCSSTGTPINPVQSVRDLGIFIEADMVMRTHVQKTVSRCFAVLRQLCSIRHSVPATTFQSPDSYCLAGTFEAGLRKCRLGRSSCLPVPASLVQRTHQPQLAPGSGESAVQDGRAHVQGHSWNYGIIPESTGSCRRSAWSTFPPLCSDQSSAGAVRETVYRWRPGLPGRRTHHLEQPTGQRDISQPSLATFRQRFKTFLFQVSFPDIITDPRYIIPNLQWILK